MRRVPAMGLVLASAVTALGGCAGATSGATTTATGSGTPSTSIGSTVMAHGTFTSVTPPPAGARAYDYDIALVPNGAMAELTVTTERANTDVRLAVTGLLPNRSYGAHLHVRPCGADPKAAGGHFQHTPDPAATDSPSTDPAYANPTNEVWLDFTTDKSGSSTSGARLPWVVSADHRPNSLVIHADQTATPAGSAGTAGPRVACLTIDY